MKPLDKKIDKDVKKGKVPDPIEDLPSEWSKEDVKNEGRAPDLGELDEDPSELLENGPRDLRLPRLETPRNQCIVHPAASRCALKQIFYAL